MQEENDKILDKEVLKEEYKLGKEYYDKIWKDIDFHV